MTSSSSSEGPIFDFSFGLEAGEWLPQRSESIPLFLHNLCVDLPNDFRTKKKTAIAAHVMSTFFRVLALRKQLKCIDDEIGRSGVFFLLPRQIEQTKGSSAEGQRRRRRRREDASSSTSQNACSGRLLKLANQARKPLATRVVHSCKGHDEKLRSLSLSLPLDRKSVV